MFFYLKFIYFSVIINNNYIFAEEIMITRRFIEKVHSYFDELNYHEKAQVNFENFEEATVNTLTLCKDLKDARFVIQMFQFCAENWSKIEKMFNKKLMKFNEYDYEGNAMISVMDQDDAFGTYYITNGITCNIKEVYIASHSFDDDIYMVDFDNGRFTIFEDGEYYMKYAKLSSVKMKLFDFNNNCLCNIVLSQNYEVFLERNATPYELIINNGYIEIYERAYINSLYDLNMIDQNEMVADIEWDIIDIDSPLGVSKLNVYKNTEDLEMFLFFATSTFLVFQKYIDN